MCGGIELSAIHKAAQKLSVGYKYPFSTDIGIITAIYGGSVRSKTLHEKWSKFIIRKIKILTDTYLEKNTTFNVPNGMAIKGVITTGNIIRIVTQPANDEVKPVHHRMPVFKEVGR